MEWYNEDKVGISGNRFTNDYNITYNIAMQHRSGSDLVILCMYIEAIHPNPSSSM